SLTGLVDEVGRYAVKPARCIPRRASAFFMNVFQTKPVRAFSAITRVMPVSIPITKGSYHFVIGLNAFTKPYRLHAWAPWRSLIVRTARIAASGRKGRDPAAAEGTMVPSMGPVAGGPPQTA